MPVASLRILVPPSVELSEREKDQLAFVRYAFLYLSRALDRELNSDSGSFQGLFGRSEERILEIGKNLLTVLEECEDELSLTVADMIAPDVKKANPDNAVRQRAIEQGRMALKLIQFYHLEVIDQLFPDFHDDSFFIAYSNDLEEEYGFQQKDAETGKMFHSKLFEYIATSV